VKDVTFKEDASRIVSNNAPENNSIIRNISINIFRDNGFDNITKGIRECCNKFFKLKEMIF